MSESGYSAVERDVILESKGGSVSTLRICREMALNAGVHGAPQFAAMLDGACGEFNRSNYRAGRFKQALKVLLYALHARPLYGGPHRSLEDAIAEANALLDDDRSGKPSSPTDSNGGGE